MGEDATFRYSGAVVLALVLGLVLGLSVTPTAGVVAGLAAAAAWLVVGAVGRRGRGTTRAGDPADL